MDNQWKARFIAGWVIVIIGLVVLLFIFHPIIAGLLIGLCVVIGVTIMVRKWRRAHKTVEKEPPKKEKD